LNAAPFGAGDFVWCKFPLSENPVQPGLEHAVYVMAVTPLPGTGHAAFVAYTTSKVLSGRPQGALRFDKLQAAQMGHARPFLLHAGRIAALPINSAYFPYLDQPGHGVIGRAPKSVQAAITEASKGLMMRRPESFERLGPLWPGQRSK
jgi:hypothetical protein